MAGADNGKSTPSMIIGIVSVIMICCCSPLAVIGGVVATVLGHQSKSEIAASGGMQGGEGKAQAGFVLGIIAIVLGTVLFIAGLAFDFASYNFEVNS